MSLARVGGTSLRFETGLGALGEVQGTHGEVRGTHEEVRYGLGDPWEGPGRVGGSSGRSRTSRETLREVQDGLVDP